MNVERGGGRPEVLVEQFEELEALARAEPETARLEFLDGRIEVRPPRDAADHALVGWLRARCGLYRPELRLYDGRGLMVETRGTGRVRPDAALAGPQYFVGAGEWADPAGVLMVAEASGNGWADVYAAAGVPVHLHVGRSTATVTIRSDAVDGRYRQVTTRTFGAVVDLPEPIRVRLDTAELKTLVD